MELILFRHAKAEDRATHLADEQRALTGKGREKAHTAARGLHHYLRGAKDIQIWASPALRSRQTAEILADALGNASLQEHPAIYSGVFEELLPLWEQAPEDLVVILVGHEPHLSIWASLLAKVSLPFKKCTAASFAYSPAMRASGRLQWFATQKTLAKMGAKKD